VIGVVSAPAGAWHPGVDDRSGVDDGFGVSFTRSGRWRRRGRSGSCRGSPPPSCTGRRAPGGVGGQVQRVAPSGGDVGDHGHQRVVLGRSRATTLARGRPGPCGAGDGGRVGQARSGQHPGGPRKRSPEAPSTRPARAGHGVTPTNWDVHLGPPRSLDAAHVGDDGIGAPDSRGQDAVDDPGGLVDGWPPRSARPRGPRPQRSGPELDAGRPHRRRRRPRSRASPLAHPAPTDPRSARPEDHGPVRPPGPPTVDRPAVVVAARISRKVVTESWRLEVHVVDWSLVRSVTWSMTRISGSTALDGQLTGQINGTAPPMERPWPGRRDMSPWP